MVTLFVGQRVISCMTSCNLLVPLQRPNAWNTVWEAMHGSNRDSSLDTSFEGRIGVGSPPEEISPPLPENTRVSFPEETVNVCAHVQMSAASCAVNASCHVLLSLQKR